MNKKYNYKIIYYFVFTIVLLLTISCANEVLINESKISGNVLFYEEPSSDVEFTITDIDSGKEFIVNSNEQGGYLLDKLWNGKYKITPKKNGYYFIPDSKTIDLAENTDLNDLNFEQYVTWKLNINEIGINVIKKAINVYEAGRVTGYILAGNKEDNVSNKSDFFIQKIDIHGNNVGQSNWAKTYGDINRIENLTDVKVVKDNGYILCGTTAADEMQSNNILLIKVNNIGEQEWKYETTNNDDENAHSVDIIYLPGNRIKYVITGSVIKNLGNNDLLSN
jgi:hypothetical protein